MGRTRERGPVVRLILEICRVSGTRLVGLSGFHAVGNDLFDPYGLSRVSRVSRLDVCHETVVADDEMQEEQESTLTPS